MLQYLIDFASGVALRPSDIVCQAIWHKARQRYCRGTFLTPSFRPLIGFDVDHGEDVEYATH